MEWAHEGGLYSAHAVELVAISSGVPYGAVTLSEGCKVLDVFSPAQTDFE